MFKLGNVTQLIFGQTFTGVYTPNSNGVYSQQIRRFQVKNAPNGQFAVDIYPSIPHSPEPAFRRRDLNILPTLQNVNNQLKYGLVAYSGVFTLQTGIWTVPVTIDQEGNPHMADPLSPATFKQGMNNYAAATVGLYSKKFTNMYHLFFGGLSYGFYDNNVFLTDAEIPFINQVTTIQIDRNGNFTQYLMSSQYPQILSTSVNPGNPLLFGAGSTFVPSTLSQYANHVLNLDNIRQPTVIGHIVGGIASTVPNTNTIADSFASTYVFKVTLIPTA